MYYATQHFVPSHKSLRMNTIKKKFGTIIHLHRYFFDNFVIWIGQKNKYIVQNKSVIYLEIYQPTVQYVQWHIRGSFRNRFLKSIKPHDLGSILSTSYFYSFTLEGLYIIFQHFKNFNNLVISYFQNMIHINPSQSVGLEICLSPQRPGFDSPRGYTHFRKKNFFFFQNFF